MSADGRFYSNDVCLFMCVCVCVLEYIPVNMYVFVVCVCVHICADTRKI